MHCEIWPFALCKEIQDVLREERAVNQELCANTAKLERQRAAAAMQDMPLKCIYVYDYHNNDRIIIVVIVAVFSMYVLVCLSFFVVIVALSILCLSCLLLLLLLFLSCISIICMLSVLQERLNEKDRTIQELKEESKSQREEMQMRQQAHRT